jgi:FKBP-type peptidyl-prolyl cis-trans isomerase
VRPLRLLAAVAALVALAACGYPDPTANSGPVATEVNAQPSPVGPDDFNAGSDKTPVKLPDGLKFVDLKIGDGAVVKSGDKLTVQYTGWLSTGSEFDSSRTSDRQPFQFTLGQQQVIPGWDEGIPGIKVGGRRKLIIPPALGYGSQGQAPSIPANATLVFIVEVLSDTPAPPTPSPSPSKSP